MTVQKVDIIHNAIHTSGAVGLGGVVHVLDYGDLAAGHEYGMEPNSHLVNPLYFLYGLWYFVVKLSQC